MLRQNTLVLVVSVLFLLSFRVVSGDFDFLEDPNMDAAGKLGALQLLSENRKTKEFNVFNVSDEEVQFLKAQFQGCDSRLLSPIYMLIESKLTLKDKTALLSKRLEIEKQAEIRDWLIEVLLGSIRCDFMKKQGDGKEAYSGFDKIMQILNSSTLDYKNHFIAGKAELIFSEALLGNKLSELEEYAYEELKEPGDLSASLDLISAFAEKIPLNDKTIALLNKMLSLKDFKLYHGKINNILLKNSIEKYMYPELEELGLPELCDVISERNNPLRMRKEALYVMTGKTNWRLFSADGGDKAIKAALLPILADENESKDIRGEIAIRIARESIHLKSEQELKRNEDLVLETLDLLRKQDEVSLSCCLLFYVPPGFYKNDRFIKKVVKHVHDKTSSPSFRCVGILFLAQCKNEGIPDLLQLVLNLLKEQNSLSENLLSFLKNAISAKYGDALKGKISALSDGDKVILEKLNQ